jgi:hypothetical protein
MSTQDPRRAQAGPALTALPRVEELPVADQGFDQTRVQEAFDAFRRHVTSLQAQLRVLQAAPRSAVSEPSGHAVRMDALHVIRAAADFADTIERDAQEAAVKQVAKAEQEIRESQMELQAQEAEIARIRQETERQRGEILNAARNEARDLLTKANRDSTQELREAEAKGARLLEQSRHQATELTNTARAEVEQTLEWARAQADVIVQRSRMGAEQLLSAAGHGDAAIREAVDAIVRAAEASVQSSRPLREPVPAPPSATPSAPSEAEPTASKPASPPLRSATTPKPSPRAAKRSPSPDEDEPPKTA